MKHVTTTTTIMMLALTMSLSAQQSGRDREEAISPNLDFSYTEGESEFSSNDEYDDEYGDQEVIGRTSNWEPWKISVRSGVYYTDNAALSSTDKIEDAFYNLGASIDYTKQITGGLFFDAGLRQDFYFYDDNSQLDFGSFETRLGLLYAAKNLGDIQFYGNHKYTRISDTGLSNSSFHQNSIEVGGLKVFRPAAGHEIYCSVSAEINLGGGPEFALRDEYRTYLGYRYKYSEHFNLGVFYRLSYNDYEENGRDDLNHSISFAANYEVFNNLWINSSIGYVKNDSDIEGFDYESFNLGGSVSLEFKF